MRDLPVLHGYTLGDLDDLARQAARGGRVVGLHAAWELAERCELAWSAIAEHLVLASERPPASHLVMAGRAAIYRNARPMTHDTPRFAAFWFAPFEPSHEERIVDRQALVQIWPRLTRREQRVLAALAVYDDYRASAEALEIPYASFTAYLSLARRRFLRQWFSPERPPYRRTTDRRVRNDGIEIDRSATAVRARQTQRRQRRLRATRATDAAPEGISS